jgi:hypothetical protein
MRACSRLTESGNVSFYSKSTAEVAQRALRESSKDSDGERESKDSNGERENDALSKAQKTKEH